MLEQDNIWKDRFNETSLGGEEWLKASDHVLENIMQEIAEKPKRKIPFWIWLVGLAALLWLALIVMSSSKLNSESQISERVASTKLQLLPGAEATIVEFNPQQNLDPEEANINSETKSAAISPQKSEEQSGLSESKIQNENIKSAKSVRSISTTKQIVQSISTPETTEGKTTILKKASKSMISLLAINKLESLQLPLLNENSSLINPDFSFAEVIEPSNNKKKLALGVFLGASIWDFNLNSNYNTALDPADFRHDNGKSIAFGLELMYEINNRLSVFGQIGIENVVFHSGHNSGLTYDSANEINNAPYNHYDLVMASPVGFMNSSISVQRNTQDELPATDIVVDLNSTHRITNIDLGIGLSLNILKTELFNLNVDFMGGINNFSSVRNTLENFTVNNTSLQSFGGMVDSSQERIDDMTPYAGLGVRAMRQLNREYTISLSLGYKSNLEPIYTENDFSTTIQRIQGSLHLSKKF